MMGTRIQFVVRTAWRNSALLAPATVVQVITMATVGALAAVVTALLNGGQSTGPLTVFLTVTVIGLLAVMVSMFGVVRAGMQRTLTTLQLMGSAPLAGRLLLGGVALLTGALGVLVGASVSWLVHRGLLWLLHSTGYHGMPTHRPSWSIAIALAAGATLVVSVLSGFSARAVRPRPMGRMPGLRRWVRPVSGSLLALAAFAVLDTGAMTSLAIGTVLGLAAAVVLAAPAVLGLAWLLGRLPLRPMVWPLGFAGRSQYARRTTSSVTVGVMAVCLFTGITALASSHEQLSRAGVAASFREDAQVLTGPSGALLNRSDAEQACHDAGSACSGIVWISGPTLWPIRDAVTTPQAASALLEDGPAGQRQGFASGVAGPWPAITVGPTPAGDWQGLPVLTHLPASPIRAAVEPARHWAQTAPSQVIIHGSGAADIGPMLLPLLLLAGLFCAAAAHTTHAAQGPELATLHRAGARPASVVAWCAAEAITTTAAIFGLGAALWWAITGAAAHLAAASGRTGYEGPHLTAALPAAAIVMVMLLTVLAATACRQARRLSL